MSENTIYIVSKHVEIHKYPTFLIDRTTVLGNKYHIGPDGTRKEVITKFKKLFYEEMIHEEPVKQYLDKIYKTFQQSNINLMCHCAPDLCHGLIIKKHLLARWERENEI